MTEDPTGTAPEDDAAASRRKLVELLEAEAVQYGGQALDPRVRDALLTVPRERFVPPDEQARAYLNRPLAIGHGQTISQPFVVAMMTQHLGIGPEARVLEVGTGSGYQTAILAELAAEVVTLEIVAPLAERARALLDVLGYRNVAFRTGDGAAGAPDRAPFDGILVTAAAPAIPPALIGQLRPGGRMVIPLGGFQHGQDLMLLEKDAAGDMRERLLFPVAFVPLTGAQR